MAAEQDIDIYIRDHFFPPRKLFGFLPDWRKRTIVEVGAARPDYLSVSASFRKLGWKVIAVEPNPQFCQAHRALGYEVLQYACSDEDKDNVDFYVVDSLGIEYMNGNVSNESFSSLGIEGKFADLHETVRDKTSTSVIKVNVRKLDTLLAQHEPGLKTIDILAVDVEGWEINVVRGFSLEKFRPKIVVLENNFGDEACKTYMAQHGYALHKHLAPNDIYCRTN